jgi:hypothetical protein
MDHPSMILGELREFKRAALERFDKLESKVDSAVHFRSKLIGMATMGAFLATLVMEFIRFKK